MKKNINNMRVTFREVEAVDSKEAIEAIRSTKKDYDLVIVGKLRVSGSQSLEVEMKPWVEHKELRELMIFLHQEIFVTG